MARFAAFLDMPALSSTGFVKLQSVVANTIHDSAGEEIRKDARKTIRIRVWQYRF